MLPHAFPLIAGATRVAKTSLVMRGKTLRTTWKALEHIITPQNAQNEGNQEHKKTTATDPEETLTISTTSSLSLSTSGFLTKRSPSCGHTTRQPAAVRSCMVQDVDLYNLVLEAVVEEVVVLLVMSVPL